MGEEMNTNALISIQGGQMMTDYGFPEPIELITPGLFTHEGDYYTISYRESELTGLEGTTTTLRVEGSRVILQRMGDVCSHMVFEQGQKHLSYYEIGDGQMTVGVNASRVRSALTDEGGRIEVDYAIEIDQAITGQNSITVNVATLMHGRQPTAHQATLM